MTTIQIILTIIISLILIVYITFIIRYCVYYFKYDRYLDNEESNILSVEEEKKKRGDIKK
jgi:TM2 domain-containing membrane protein YozV